MAAILAFHAPLGQLSLSQGVGASGPSPGIPMIPAIAARPVEEFAP